MFQVRDESKIILDVSGWDKSNFFEIFQVRDESKFF